MSAASPEWKLPSHPACCTLRLESHGAGAGAVSCMKGGPEVPARKRRYAWEVISEWQSRVGGDLGTLLAAVPALPRGGRRGGHGAYGTSAPMRRYNSISCMTQLQANHGAASDTGCAAAAPSRPGGPSSNSHRRIHSPQQLLRGCSAAEGPSTEYLSDGADSICSITKSHQVVLAVGATHAAQVPNNYGKLRRATRTIYGRGNGQPPACVAGRLCA